MLDASQRAVVDHPGGPALVLAGPGTGKTTTLVELVAARVAAGLPPEAVLVLTFSRRAAAEVRERITTRLGATVSTPAAFTFHAWCHALLRAEQPAEPGREPVRLLSGPEQDVALREMLQGSLETGRPVWPDQLRACLPTRGFAEEVHRLLARARELGLDPGDLAAAGRRRHRPEWTALGRFFADWLDVLDAQGAVDYAELVHRARLLVARPEVRERLRRRYRLVVVDEFQDTDPAQEGLLRALAGDGGDLVVVGDPDQSIYAFRGAEVDNLLGFPDRFRTSTGERAAVYTLDTCRRSGPVLLAATRRVAARLPMPLSASDARARHRDLRPGGSDPAGSVEVSTHPTAGAEAAAVADVLRRAHLSDGTPWSRMAVLVRTGRAVPLLRRMLTSAGVPVEVAGDEIPLARDPAVTPLLSALRCAADPAGLTVEQAAALLTGPLVGAEPGRLRRLGRALRAADLSADPAAAPRPSAELLRDAVLDPTLLLPVDPDDAAPVRQLSELLRAAAREAAGPSAAEGALWALWSGSSWRRRLVDASAAGGPVGRAADRDLDAVVALFATVARAGERRHRQPGIATLLEELEAQQIPGDAGDERSVRGEAVRLLTAHRSKGLEWDLVVVPGVQEGVWPDLRERYSLLGVEELDGSPRPGRAALLAEERRLFYVACTRARHRLVVTAVDSSEDDGERPSRFLTELGVPVRQERQRARRPLTLPALVATLRRLAADPGANVGARQEAARRLARLAAAVGPDGQPLVPAAHPSHWWGVDTVTRSEVPLQSPGEAVGLSGTTLREIERCPLRWFLRRRAQAQVPASGAQTFGSLVHAVARELGAGELPATLDALTDRVEQVWGRLQFEAPWRGEQEREEIRDALRRLLAWHLADERRLLGVEVPFETTVPAGAAGVRLRGSLDRVELAADGSLVVVDLKTGRQAQSARETAEDPQLGVYQLAVDVGAVRPAGAPAPVRAGGAELVYVRAQSASATVREQPRPTDDRVLQALAEAARVVLEEDVRPRPSDDCERCEYRAACPATEAGREVVP